MDWTSDDREQGTRQESRGVMIDLLKGMGELCELPPFNIEWLEQHLVAPRERGRA